MPNVSRADCVPVFKIKTQAFAGYCKTAQFNQRPACVSAWTQLIEIMEKLRNVTGPMPECDLERKTAEALKGND